jgi:hypothetical protein
VLLKQNTHPTNFTMQVTKDFKIEEKIQAEIEELLLLTDDFISEDVSIHEMEKGILKRLLKLGLALLIYVIESKTKELTGYRPKSGEGKLLESKGLKERKYLSLFGWIDVLRPRHWSKEGGSYYELDERLNLPRASNWSYNLQEWIGENAAENDFRESVRLLNKLLGLNLSGKSSERNAERLGTLVESYYENREKDVEEEAICFSGSFDGKGVPKIKKKKEQEGNPKKRLNKGEKNGIKQMATVSVTSSFVPKVRTKDGIMRGLMGSPLSKVEQDDQSPKVHKKKENDNCWHQNIHRRAFLNDQAKSIEYGLDDIRKRMTNPKSRFVVPIDAGIGLEDKIMAYVEKYGMEEQFDGIIIDIIHVSEYVWDAATATLGENSKLRTDWVRKVLEDLLDNKTDKVIQDFILIIDKANLSENKQKQVNKAITYFTNHKHKMDYKTFIKKGYPVSSALVESACGHLIKERMEQSGMRWSSDGAQNIMDLRAVKLNEDMEDFRDFVIKYEHKKIQNLAA